MIEPDSPRARVVAYITEKKPKPVCAKCIAQALDIRPSAAQRVATLLEGTPGYEREHGICGVCGQRRLTVRRL